MKYYEETKLPKNKENKLNMQEVLYRTQHIFINRKNDCHFANKS